MEGVASRGAADQKLSGECVPMGMRVGGNISYTGFGFRILGLGFGFRVSSFGFASMALFLVPDFIIINRDDTFWDEWYEEYSWKKKSEKKGILQ